MMKRIMQSVPSAGMLCCLSTFAPSGREAARPSSDWQQPVMIEVPDNSIAVGVPALVKPGEMIGRVVEVG